MGVPTGVSSALLALLRDRLDEPGLRYVVAPRRLAGGAFSDVFEFELDGAPDPFGGRLVLRLYPPDASPSAPLVERAVHAGVGVTGLAVPRVLLVGPGLGGSGRMFTIVPRLEGRSFLRGIRWDQFARDFPRLLISWPRTAAGVLARLHTGSAVAVRRAAADEGLDDATVSAGRHLAGIERRLTTFGHNGVDDGLDWLRVNEPPVSETPTVLHGDLWPGNVLMCGRKVSGVIDWDRAALGDPALDIGFAKAGLALMPAPFPPPSPLRQAVHAAGTALARDLHRAYGRMRPIDDRLVDYYEALRCFLELSFVVEHRVRRARDANPSPVVTPWDSGSAALAQRFTAITDVALDLPERSP